MLHLETKQKCIHTIGIIQEEYTDHSYTQILEIPDITRLLKTKDTYHITVTRNRFCPKCGKDIQNYTFPKETVNN